MNPAHPLRLILALALLLATPIPRATAKDSVVQCANLIYGGTHTSKCFSDEFLSAVQRQTTIPTERRFKSVKLGSEEVFGFPFVVMTGEGNFHFTAPERANLRKYLTNGGFLLASAGCSSKDWDRSFRREIASVMEGAPLAPIPQDHLLFRTVRKIPELQLSHKEAKPPQLEGIEHQGKLVVVYSPHGLNDTAHTQGCCCCGGNEIKNSLEVNMNILVYALLY